MSASSPPVESSTVPFFAPRTSAIAALGAGMFTHGSVVPIAVSLTLALGFADWFTPVEISFTLLFLFPVALATWVRGRRFGNVISVLAAACGIMTSIRGGGEFAEPGAVLWNLVTSLTVFLIFTRLLDATHRLLTLEQQQHRTAIDLLRHGERLQVIGTLAAGVAHELGTPLNVVRGFADVLATRSLSEEKSRDMLRSIRGQADRMTTIVRQMLDFGRRGSAAKLLVDLNEVSRGAVQMLVPMALKANCKIQLAPSATPIKARVASSEIQQVLCNLIVNAIHATGTGGEVIVRTDVVTHAGAGAFGRVRVEDHGVGIRPEDLPRIFDPFFTTKTVGEGTGLGLSVSHGIVTDHGGTIRVDSVLGSGTTVTVLLPLGASLLTA